MYELSVASKYLTPRWRQLSVSIISLISILVIALVVWLIVVFFSVTNGLEKSWIDKLIALTAPVRVTPTDAYYRSYYYRIDSISAASDYSLKTIGEKLNAPVTDPYDPGTDEEIPKNWPRPDLDPDGHPKDLVKIVYQSIDALHDIPGVKAKDFEMTAGNAHLQLLRNLPGPSTSKSSPFDQYTEATLQQASYLGSFDPDNPNLDKAVLPLTNNDLNNIFAMTGIASDNVREDTSGTLLNAPKDLLRSRLKSFFATVDVKELITPYSTWTIPKDLLPNSAIFKAYAIYKGVRPVRVIIPQTTGAHPEMVKGWIKEGYKVQPITLEFRNAQPYMVIEGQEQQPLPKFVSISVAPQVPVPARLDAASLDKADNPTDILFDLNFTLQNVVFKGKAPIGNLSIHKADPLLTSKPDAERQPLWVHRQLNALNESQLVLPSDPLYGDGIILPRSFREAGVYAGDRGYLSYATPTTSVVQEQRIPVFVAGFYDPGVIPIGGKYILVNQQVTSLIRSSHNQEDTTLSNGINIRFSNINQAGQVKNSLQKALDDSGIAPYWKVETFREYDFTRDLIQQLRSEKNLFTLLATIIIIVACSNIISMLIILVNDKKLEIGIMRSMGASSLSIAAIFGTCGVIMGVVGSLIGTLAAYITLKNLQSLVGLISKIQGYDMFNPMFFGETLPADLSFEALSFVIVATGLISLLAGLVPAIKASMMRPSAILRSE